MTVPKSLEEQKINAEVQIVLCNKQIASEVNARRIFQDRTALKNAVEGMSAAGEPLPADSAYANYEEWIKECTKDVSVSGSILRNIETAKMNVVTFQYFSDYFPAKPVGA
ncbi:MAG: hypothetical protein ACRCSK_06075 [Fusobacteriaceae bacterium]